MAVLAFRHYGAQLRPRLLWQARARNVISRKEEVVTVETEGTDESLKLDEKVENLKPGIEKRIIPIEKISAIYAYGRISFTSGVISYLSQYGTPVHFYNYYGFYEGSYYPRETLLSGDLLIKQVAHYTAKQKRQVIAREFVRGAAENIMRNLEYYNREGKAVSAEMAMIRNLMASVPKTNDIPQLMAIEGAIRNTYYKTYDKILPASFRFGVRTKQPPENPLNALISFGNSLMYGTVLTEKGRRTFLAEWDAKLKTTIKHRELKRNVSYQRLIRLECYKLTKHLLGTKPYKPFVIWW